VRHTLNETLIFTDTTVIIIILLNTFGDAPEVNVRRSNRGI
jgi:hypothetical protein